MSDGRGSGVIPPAKGAIQVKCPGSGWLSRQRPPVLSWWSCRHSGPEFTSVVTLHGEANRRDLSNPDDRFFLRIEVAHACRSSDDTSRRLRSALADRARDGVPIRDRGRLATRATLSVHARRCDLSPDHQALGWAVW